MIGPCLIDRRRWQPPRVVRAVPCLRLRFDPPRFVRRAATL
jgi:hypothetical protein